MWLETKYANLISPYVRNFKVRSNSLFNFSCPFCGDSATRTHLARGYLYQEDDELRYKCHNCGITSNFNYFLRNLDYNLYRQYKIEKFKPEIKKKKFDYNEIKDDTKKIQVKTGIEALFEPLNDKAKKYLESRQITRNEDIHFTSNLKKLESFFPNKELPSDERIIFPIRNRQGNIVGISARSIDPKCKLRYALLKLGDEPLIFGLDKVNIGKPVFVLEGAIDSLHLENAVAVNGSDLEKVKQFIPIKNQILVFDNQPRNKEIINKMLNANKHGYSMVIWPKNISEKDINLMAKNYGMKKVNEWLKNTYKGLSCKAKIVDWKLV